MANNKIVQAWKNEEYRMAMTAEERASLPENPAGIVELTDEALDDLIAGSEDSDSCCWGSCGVVVAEV